MNTVELGIEYLFPYLKCFDVQFKIISYQKKKKVEDYQVLANMEKWNKIKLAKHFKKI